MQDDLRALLRLLAARCVRVRPMIGEPAAPDQTPAAYRRLAKSDCPPPWVVFAWQDKDATP